MVARALRHRIVARRRKPRLPQRILVVHHLLLGDTLMLTALLAKLREQHPAADIVMGLPEAYVSPPPDILERIQRESARFRQARARDTDASWFAEGFDWPAMGIISSLYGSQRILNGEPRAPHLAVDIAAPTGTPIHAPADGIVSLIDDQYLNGLFTILDHGHGVSTNYVHQSKQLVTLGDRVTRGQIIGEIGQTGRATGPNLHWGMTWFQVALDPSLSTPMPKPEKA